MLLEASLFGASFLAATIFPLSSEAALLGALHAGMKTNTALYIASFGNVAAIIVNYFLGYFLYNATKRKLLASKTGRAMFSWGEKFGYFSLLFSWMPIIGDPLTLAAGLFRLNFWLFLFIAGSLRILRYYLIVISF